MNLVASLLALVAALTGLGDPPDPPPKSEPAARLAAAHAHNDYRHRTPCTGALDLGFASIEVDVFPVGDELLVGHDPPDLRPERTIDRLYLEPIQRRCEEAGPGIGPLPDGGRILLLVDIKRHGERALQLLEPRLEPLRPWLARVEEGRFIDGPVMVLLSGARPVETVSKRDSRLVFLDGRVADLERNPPADLVPLISAPYMQTLRAFPFGKPNADAAERMRSLAERAADQGRRLRFWGHLDDPRIWEALLDAGVDLVGTDDPSRFAKWYRARLESTDPRADDDPVAENTSQGR